MCMSTLQINSESWMCYDVVEEPKPEERIVQRNQNPYYVHDKTIIVWNDSHGKSSKYSLYYSTSDIISIK